MADRIEIFDTTLRDGEQSPGASMHAHEKIQMARQLERLGVDIIEAGFPIASEQEFEGVRTVAGAIKKARVAALARAMARDIDRAAEALEPAENPVLHTFIATSDIHLKHKLRMSRAQVLDAAAEAVRRAKGLIGRVEFSAEDATRSDLEYLIEVTKAVIQAGADVVNLPDTVGYTTPEEIHEMFRRAIAESPGSDRVMFSCHNHNDLGLAVSNALAAIRAGARQVECCVNGIGERAGNTSLEEVVMAIRTRHDNYPYECGVITEEIVATSTLLCKVTGLTVAYNKPIVGRNAFAHEAGIHQHGMIANKKTYEIMTPESVGRSRSDLVLGKHSGRHGLSKRCEQLGFQLSEAEVEHLYKQFIALADRKKEVFDDDLRVLIASYRDESFETYHLDTVRTSGGEPPMAVVRLKKGEDILVDAATGDGPVDAAYRAIEKLVGVEGKIQEFNIRAATPGKDALGESHVSVLFNERLYSGQGASTDINEAAVLAYLDALNKYLAVRSSA